MVELHVKCCRLQYFSHQTPPITFADFTHTSSDEILISYKSASICSTACLLYQIHAIV